MSYTYQQLTGLGSTDNIEIGLGRLDVAPYGSNNLLPFGCLEGTAEVSFTRTNVDVKAGIPQAVIKRIISEEGGTMKVTLLETSAQRVQIALGGPDSQYVSTSGGVAVATPELVQFNGQTPVKLLHGNISGSVTVALTNPAVPVNMGTSNGQASQTFTLPAHPVVALSDAITVGSIAWSRVSTLVGQGPTATVYTIVDATGVVTFGDGTTGAIPPLGATFMVAYSCSTTYAANTDYIEDDVNGWLTRTAVGGSITDGEYVYVSYSYNVVAAETVHFGGYSTVQEYSVQFTHPMTTGKWEIVNFYRAVPTSPTNLTWQAAAVNSRSLEWTALADIARISGDMIGSYQITSTAPFFM